MDVHPLEHTLATVASLMTAAGDSTQANLNACSSALNAEKVAHEATKAEHKAECEAHDVAKRDLADARARVEQLEAKLDSHAVEAPVPELANVEAAHG